MVVPLRTKVAILTAAACLFRVGNLCAESDADANPILPDLFVMAADAEIERSAAELCSLAAADSHVKSRYNSMQIMRYRLAVRATAENQRDAVLKQNATQWNALAETPKPCFGKAREVGHGAGTSQAIAVARTTGVYIERAGARANLVWISNTFPNGQKTTQESRYAVHTDDHKRVARAIGIAAFALPVDTTIDATLSLNVASADQCRVNSPSCVRVGAKATARLEIRDTLWMKSSEASVRWSAECDGYRPGATLTKVSGDVSRSFLVALDFRRESKCRVFAEIDQGSAANDVSPVRSVRTVNVESEVAAALIWRGGTNRRVNVTYRQRRWAPFFSASLTSEAVRNTLLTGMAVVPGRAIRDWSRSVASALEESVGEAGAESTNKLNIRVRKLLGEELESWGDRLGHQLLGDGLPALAHGQEVTAFRIIGGLRRVNFCGAIHDRVEAKLVQEGYLDARTIFSSPNTLAFDETCERLAGSNAFLDDLTMKARRAEAASSLAQLSLLHAQLELYGASENAANSTMEQARDAMGPGQGRPDRGLELKKARAADELTIQGAVSATEKAAAVVRGLTADIKAISLRKPSRLVLRRGDIRLAARYRVMTNLRSSDVAEVRASDIGIAEEYPDDAMPEENVVVQGLDAEDRLSEPVELRVEIVPRTPSFALRLGYSWGRQTTREGVTRSRRGVDFGFSLLALDQWTEIQADVIANTNLSVREGEVHGERARLSTGGLVNLECFLKNETGICPSLTWGVGGGYEWLDGGPYGRMRLGWRFRTPTIVQLVPHFAASLYSRRTNFEAFNATFETSSLSYSLVLAVDLWVL